MRSAAYNSRILNMLAPIPSRLVVASRFPVIAFVFAIFLAGPAGAQNREAAVQQLATKIAAATGQKTIALEVLNRSSLSAAASDDIRRNLLTQLAVLGVRFGAEAQGASRVRVSLSEDLQNYVWIAEVGPDSGSASIVMVSLPRAARVPAEPDATAIVIRKIPVWSQPERILDIAVSDGNPARMLVLDASGVTTYRLENNRWQQQQSLPAPHSRPWPRDLRGRLILDNSHFDAYLPGVHCRGSASELAVMTCSDSDEPWALGSGALTLNASFASARNFFSGALSPGPGKQMTVPAFYSAAAVPRDGTLWWLLATVDGRVHLLDGTTDQVLSQLNWGSDIAAVRSGCGSGWQILATGTGQGRTDVVKAFEVSAREPVATGAPVSVSGPITALWTESGGGGAIAVVHNLDTERYEALRLTVTCGP